MNIAIEGKRVDRLYNIKEVHAEVINLSPSTIARRVQDGSSRRPWSSDGADSGAAATSQRS